MSYHSMGQLAPSLATRSLTTSLPSVQAPLQLTNLPGRAGSVRLDGPTTRRVDKSKGQTSMGLQVKPGSYRLFFRPSGGRYQFLGSVRVPSSGSVTFNAGEKASTDVVSSLYTGGSSGGGETATTRATAQVAPARESEVEIATTQATQQLAPAEQETTVSPSGRGFVLPGAETEPDGGGEAEFVYEPEEGGDVSPRVPGSASGPGAGPGGAGPGGGPAERQQHAAPPKDEDKTNWVPWALGGAAVLGGIGLVWYLTQR